MPIAAWLAGHRGPMSNSARNALIPANSRPSQRVDFVIRPTPSATPVTPSAVRISMKGSRKRTWRTSKKYSIQRSASTIISGLSRTSSVSDSVTTRVRRRANPATMPPRSRIT